MEADNLEERALASGAGRQPDLIFKQFINISVNYLQITVKKSWLFHGN